jgi:type III pantothenate kinase
LLLTVDVGNTQTHLGVWDGGRLTHQWRASTDPARTADELAMFFGEFLTMAGMSLPSQITGIAICSVVPSVTQELRELASRYFGFGAVVVEPGIKTGIAVLTDNPKEVGADRIANAVAAHEIFPTENAVVVDFGTAITVDAVSDQGEYIGGAIAPGLETAASALFHATAQIRRVELGDAPPSALGRSTVTSVQSGIIYGTTDLVDGLVDRITQELGGNSRVIATGGFAPSISRHSKRIERVEPILTLTGLRLIFERNADRREPAT